MTSRLVLNLLSSAVALASLLGCVGKSNIQSGSGHEARGSYQETSTACAAEPLTPAPWQPNKLYVYGQRVTNDGDKVYQMVSTTAPAGGKSAARGGPTGTSNAISDNQLTWAYSMPSASGKVYYACDCGSGADPSCAANNTAASDDNPGTDPAKPWRTLEKARQAFGAMAAGDTIALCRGGAFLLANDNEWNNSSCQANSNCTVRDYYPAWDTGHTGSLPSTLSQKKDGRSHGMAVGGAGYYRFLNLSVKTTDAVTWGYGVARTIRDLTICNNEIDGYEVGIQDDCGEHSPDTNEQLRIMGNRIVNSGGFGVLIGGNESIVADNYFNNNGSRPSSPTDGKFLHDIYISNGATTGGANDDGATRVWVTGNELHNSVPNGSGLCQGVPIVVHGRTQGLVIENNLVWEPHSTGGCYGIGVGPGGYKNSEYFRDTIIRGNRVFAGNTGITVGNCPRCIIENNLVLMDQAYSGIRVPDRASSDGGDLTTQNVIRNNTIYFGPGVSAAKDSLLGVMVGIEGEGYEIANNAIYFAGTGQFFGCLDLTLPHDAAHYALVDNNLCWAPNASKWSWEYSAWKSLADFQALGFDAHSIALPSAGPSPFVNAGLDEQTLDFTPADGSPLIGAGTTASTCTIGDKANQPCGSPIDLTGKARDDHPDIGAYER